VRHDRSLDPHRAQAKEDCTRGSREVSNGTEAQRHQVRSRSLKGCLTLFRAKIYSKQRREEKVQMKKTSVYPTLLMVYSRHSD
jgi:hypothetical protein